jgi:nickel-dependent lactate racemase
MKIELPYHRHRIPIEIPDGIQTEIVTAREHPSRVQSDLFRQALANPLNSVSVEEFMNSGQEFFFIINDATRPTPTAVVLESVYDIIRDKDIKFMIATGIHRSPTPKELQDIMGRFYLEFKDCILIHDARNEDELVKVGHSRAGYEIWINRHVHQARKLAVINSVEPHYFAGYTGGRKSFFPGIAGYHTIEQNHRFAMSQDSCSLKLRGNPVHEDMVDSLRCLGNKDIFSIQTVLDLKNNIFAVTAGHIHDSFIAAVKEAESIFSVKVRNRSDIVIAVVLPPKDINLYQAQNSLENAKLILKDGGILILVSPCREGIGPSVFFDLLSGFNTPQDVLRAVESGYKLGYHKALKIAQILERAEIWGITELPESQLESIFIRSFHSLQEAVDQAIQRQGSRASITVLMDSDRTVPVIEP